ncbi:hypothetical protein RB653_007333 [Dictyostelium firmibasis]|uniref:Uncharacterized protein n=1 Tax=Dictyostelium firmibasis TaxID=79012 RepID=A0AAN7TUC4_9MYCE
MKFMSFLILLFIILILNNFVLSGTANEVTLTVNLNNNNNYSINGECGTSNSKTCNNINDAINYFNTIANNSGVSPQIIYQQLNLLLDDGNYSVENSTVNFYQYNVTISPLYFGSNKVIFNGLNSKTAINNSPMFSVIPNNGIIDTLSLNSYIVISGIQFLNFKQPIIKVSTNISFTDIRIESCSINQYNSNNSMIEINKLFAQQLTLPNNHLKINNSQISNIQTDNKTPLIYAINTIINYDQTDITNATVQSIIDTSFGEYLIVSFSNFLNINSVNGIFNVFNTHASVGDGNFNNNVASNGASVLTYTLNVTHVFSAALARGNFIGNIGSNGGVFYGVNTFPGLETLTTSISQCTFSSGFANNGGAIYTNNIPISVVNSQFGDTTATTAGGHIYSSGNVLSLVNVSFTQAPIIPTTTTTTIDTADEIKGYVIFASNSTVYIKNGTIDSKLVDSIYCNGSSINVDVYSKISTVSCNKCNVFLGENQVCNIGGGSVSTSTSGTGSGISISSSSGSSQTLTITSTGSNSHTSGISSSSSTGHTVTTITSTSGSPSKFLPSYANLLFILLFSLVLSF